MTRGRPPYNDVLTPREWEVIDLIREGLTNPQIAERLGISLNTAKYHVSAILTKLELPTREAAAAWQPTHQRSWIRRVVAFLAVGRVAHGLGSGKVVLGGIAAAGATGVFVVALAMLASSHDPDAGRLGKLVYVQAGDLWVTALPSGKPHRLTTDGNHSLPRWSPSGKWLSYSSGETAGLNADVSVMRADGSDARELDVAPYYPVTWASGDLLVYSDPAGNVVTEEADGSNHRVVLTRQSTATEETSVFSYGSSDGRTLVYVESSWPAGTGRIPSNSPLSVGPDDERQRVALGLVNVDGSDKRELVVASGQQLFYVGLSSDHQAMLYVTNPFDATEGVQDGLPLHSVSVADGTTRTIPGLVALTNIGAAAAPDRDSFAVAVGDQRESWTNKQLELFTSDGSTTILTSPEVAVQAPAWSPDGRTLAYVAAPDLGAAGRDAALASRRIWLINADGSSPRPLTAGEGFRDAFPRWSLDGSHILFIRMTLKVCAPTWTLQLLDVGSGSVQEVASGLPGVSSLFNERPVIGEVPQCVDSVDEPGTISDSYGAFSGVVAFDWWRGAPAN